jgi:hypothetical protein
MRSSESLLPKSAVNEEENDFQIQYLINCSLWMLALVTAENASIFSQWFDQKSSQIKDRMVFPNELIFPI